MEYIGPHEIPSMPTDSLEFVTDLSAHQCSSPGCKNKILGGEVIRIICNNWIPVNFPVVICYACIVTVMRPEDYTSYPVGTIQLSEAQLKTIESGPSDFYDKVVIPEVYRQLLSPVSATVGKGQAFFRCKGCNALEEIGK